MALNKLDVLKQQKRLSNKRMESLKLHAGKEIANIRKETEEI